MGGDHPSRGSPQPRRKRTESFVFDLTLIRRVYPGHAEKRWELTTVEIQRKALTQGMFGDDSCAWESVNRKADVHGVAAFSC
jgi:hypothetical protein